MMEELKSTILNRVIHELFQEADKLIKEGVKLTQKNKKMITIGLSMSVAGLAHAIMSPATAIVWDCFNLMIMGASFTNTNMESVQLEVDKVKEFFTHFDVEKEDIVETLKEEFTSTLRVGTYFNTEEIQNIIEKGILNLRKEEIEAFAKIQFNDNQEKYLKALISTNEKINVMNFLDLSLLEGSIQNKKFVMLGGKNKTLQDIMQPQKKVQLMK